MRSASIALSLAFLALGPAAAADDNPLSAITTIEAVDSNEKSALDLVTITAARQEAARAKTAELVARFDVLDKHYRSGVFVDWDSRERREALRVRNLAMADALKAGEEFYAAKFEYESALRALEAARKKPAQLATPGTNISRDGASVPSSTNAPAGVVGGAASAGISR